MANLEIWEKKVVSPQSAPARQERRIGKHGTPGSLKDRCWTEEANHLGWDTHVFCSLGCVTNAQFGWTPSKHSPGTQEEEKLKTKMEEEAEVSVSVCLVLHKECDAVTYSREEEVGTATFVTALCASEAGHGVIPKPCLLSSSTPVNTRLPLSPNVSNSAHCHQLPAICFLNFVLHPQMNTSSSTPPGTLWW